ncbi:MAG: hypothetical protein KZQ92_10955 [Candidatus Thiodiazotropha sp. (ex Lucinoma borealis)]|nr:hypothetical protein [Candidatus Thiodiazotropha sp. (ex Lucinoma borealis)]MCU7864481.1 hypothetical protein [Candidatus Thiodiazotropha sp. (ex Lucinoma borealis)]MCU7868244.1 hypothetical protein [Candidatus Thiodiazotropha sp. (ex Lucinoma borealis)]
MFEKIEQDDSHASILGIPVSQRFLIGDRLLVYLWDLKDIVSLEKELANIVAIGKSERDKKGYNRFRLVILTHGSGDLKEKAGELFAIAAGDDNKLHIHVINASEVQQTLGYLES